MHKTLDGKQFDIYCMK